MSGYKLIDEATCLVEGPDGVQYREFMCRFPIFEPLYFGFEKYHKANGGFVLPYVPAKDWMRNHPEVPIIAVIVYAIAIYFGKKYMETREPFKWRSQLVST